MHVEVREEDMNTCAAQGTQKRVMEALELEHSIWLLGTSSLRAARDFNHSPTPRIPFPKVEMSSTGSVLAGNSPLYGAKGRAVWRETNVY